MQGWCNERDTAVAAVAAVAAGKHICFLKQNGFVECEMLVSMEAKQVFTSGRGSLGPPCYMNYTYHGPSPLSGKFQQDLRDFFMTWIIPNKNEQGRQDEKKNCTCAHAHTYHHQFLPDPRGARLHEAFMRQFLAIHASVCLFVPPSQFGLLLSYMANIPQDPNIFYGLFMSYKMTTRGDYQRCRQPPNGSHLIKSSLTLRNFFLCRC